MIHNGTMQGRLGSFPALLLNTLVLELIRNGVGSLCSGIGTYL